MPDRDCVLTWQSKEAADRPSLEVLAHDDPDSGFVYFLAMVAPPATRDLGRGTPREVVMLVDHSGSMAGAKWQAADWAVERFLSDLTGRDRFALGLFHTSTKWFAKAPRAADPKAVAEAVAFLKANREDGGTELGVALEQAIGQARKDVEAARHVLIVTDAEVSDAGRILKLAAQESRRPDRRRISVLCIDAAPNSYLALELAEQGGGVARFLTSDPAQEDIATALDEVLADWAEPVLAGLRLEVDRPDARGSGRGSVEVGQPGWSGIDLGDLPAGRSLWVVGRVPRTESSSVGFRLATARGHELAEVSSGKLGEVPEGPAIKALFGTRQILGLEHLIQSLATGDELSEGLRRLGYDPMPILEDPARVYEENARSESQDRLREPPGPRVARPWGRLLGNRLLCPADGSGPGGRGTGRSGQRPAGGVVGGVPYEVRFVESLLKARPGSGGFSVPDDGRGDRPVYDAPVRGGRWAGRVASSSRRLEAWGDASWRHAESTLRSGPDRFEAAGSGDPSYIDGCLPGDALNGQRRSGAFRHREGPGHGDPARPGDP